ncbi:short-chain alcohol dehydrogenase [Pseudovirgaria hyperparasitica]|uniref:Short-chain alcohol dehydrogenase n=1 Tax=Pseudovirgaria hyperparasitica TaxID=470096 RepID=A0A6A6WB88_9PEZI|nr:short-chain alcohol dehydrogenase [Pseudovirgaria hyperparasitica]KAF2758371.1 short-chain alcohol dehydrogenase [Pseudovirgaria hyperparasitica]
MGYTILITGASSGFGALTARALAKAGHNVYAGHRSLRTESAAVEKDSTFNKEHGLEIHALELDVTKDESCKAAVEKVITEAGSLDVVVHNAGHMGFGPLEAFTPDQLLSMFDVNALGTHRLNRAFLPYMRKKGTGLVLYVGSTSTRGAMPPFLGPYFAAKAAMDSLAVSMAAELSLWGIETSIVVPGAFPTGTNHFTNAARPHDTNVAIEYETGAYQGVSQRVDKAFENMTPKDNPPDVNDVAKAIVEVVGTAHGRRPFRVHIDPLNDGAEDVSKVADKIRADYYTQNNLGDLLAPKATTG